MRKLECLVNTGEVNQIIEDTLPILDKKFGVLEEYTKEMEDILKNAPRDSEGYLLAPNGKRSNLTERQYAQVRTKAFKEWFGDWENDPTNASKVVDENGEPLVTWHSTLVEIENNIFKDYEDITISRNEEWVTDKNIYDYKKEGYIITNNDNLAFLLVKKLSSLPGITLSVVKNIAFLVPPAFAK